MPCDLCRDLTPEEQRADGAGSYALAIASLRADYLALTNSAALAQFPSAALSVVADMPVLLLPAGVTRSRGSGCAALSSPTGDQA